MKLKELFKENNTKEENNIITILKGSIVAILITLIGLFILSLVLSYTSANENISKAIIMILTAVSIIFGSIISTRKVNKKGLINGGIVGLIYILFIYFLSSIFVSGFSMNLQTFIMFIISIVAGIIGGIIGVNI